MLTDSNQLKLINFDFALKSLNVYVIDYNMLTWSGLGATIVDETSIMVFGTS